MDKEILLDTLLNQYSEEVTNIIYECHQDAKVYLDVDSLNAGLNSLMLVSFRKGLSESDWYGLVYELAPDVYDELAYGNIAA